MLFAAGQAVAEAAKQGNIMVSIPTGLISSVATLLLYKGVPLIFNAIRGKKNGNGVKPGMGVECREHGEDIAALMQFKASCEGSLVRIETKVDRLLERK
jgi:hypothetical protein